jgi:hypothetical protein
MLVCNARQQRLRLYFRGAHHVEQCRYIDLRVTQSRSRLGIRDLFHSALDLRDPHRSLRQIARVAREHIHEVVGPPRRRFQLVTIKTIVFEVHERIARLYKTRTQRLEVGSDLRVLRTR